MESVKYFTSIDPCSRYWQCHIAGEDILKTTFLQSHDLYKWVAMSMALMNAPIKFMSTINNLFSDMLDSGIMVFLDNILVYSCMVKEHFTLIDMVLVCLYQVYILLQANKCSFLHNSTIFLGFNITPLGIYISDSKLQSLNEWPVIMPVK